jgi:hypothetical protein
MEKSMVVCAHGDVAKFCESHEMEILESYSGNLADYKGNCAVVVTDQRMGRSEYDSLKCELFGRGVELVSVEWTDDEVILRLLRNQIEQRGKRGGRQMFGLRKDKGRLVEMPEKMALARRIIDLWYAGRTYREIREEVGGGISLSTIQTIIKNRDKYERK